MRYLTLTLTLLGFINLAVGFWLPMDAHFRSAETTRAITAMYDDLDEGASTPSIDRGALSQLMRDRFAKPILAPALGIQGLLLIVIAYCLEIRARREYTRPAAGD